MLRIQICQGAEQLVLRWNVLVFLTLRAESDILNEKNIVNLSHLLNKELIHVLAQAFTNIRRYKTLNHNQNIAKRGQRNPILITIWKLTLSMKLREPILNNDEQLLQFFLRNEELDANHMRE